MSNLSAEMRDMLVDSASKFITAEYDFESRQKLAASDLGYSTEHWQAFAELGWLSIPFSEDDGGLGGELVDMAGLVEQLGSGLVLEPWFSSVVLAGMAVAQSDNAAIKESLIPAIACGEQIISLAWEEQNSGANASRIEASATASNGGYTLNGRKVNVLAGPQAQGFIVSALIEDKIGLFYLPNDAEGLSIESFSLIDGAKAANLSLNNVTVGSDQVISTDGQAILSNTINGGIYILCAEAMGCMEKLLQITAEYTKTRKQFGVPIATFQSLRHFLADMYVILKKARCFHQHCTDVLRSTGELSDESIAILKVQTGRAAHHIGRQAIQIHGGIGMTDELDVGHYVKRLTAIDALLGNSRYHLQSLANAL